MGKASSQKKVARAATTGGGRTAGAKRPMGWYSTMAAVVALGVFLVGFSRNQELSRGQAATKVAPRINQDHWHSSFSVYVCDHFAPNVPLFESVDGIHTHGDGVIHAHPFTAKAAGNNATLGFFVGAIPGGVKVTLTELKYVQPAGDTNTLDGKDWKNGDKCPDGQSGKVKWTVNGKAQTTDPRAWKLRNGDYIDVGFIDDSKPLPSNPAERANLANINDVKTTTGTTSPTTKAPTASTPTTSAATPTTASTPTTSAATPTTAGNTTPPTTASTPTTTK